MRYLVPGGKHATIRMDTEIDPALLSGKFAAIRTMPALPGTPAAELAILEQRYPVEQYDPDQHAPWRNINGR